MTSLGIAGGPLETRSSTGGGSGYTSLILRGLTAAADGDVSASVEGLAVAEAVRGLWRRSLSACTVTPATAAAVLDRGMLSLIADSLLSAEGEYVGVLDVAFDGRMVLLPAADVYIHSGHPDPAAWVYQTWVSAPTGGYLRRTVTRETVMHVQWRRDKRTPWYSVGPWVAASTTATLAARLERAIAREVNSPVGTAIPIPASLPDPAQDALKAAMAALKGGLALVPTSAGGGGIGMHDAPQRDWRTTRIGPAPTKETVDLRGMTCRDISTAAGVP